MKQFNFVKKVLLVSFLCAAGAVNGQTVHPRSFGIVGTATNTNWYIDYVDTRFEVTAPASIAGDKRFTKADPVNAGWTAMVYTSLPLINVPIVMGPAGDTQACTNFTAGTMTGKIAFIWRGNCEFGAKALNAQNAGAVAVVICNNLPGSFPFNMGAGAVGASVTIPTFMISNADGVAISGAYGAGAGTVTMTITQWGLNLQNDLGFIPQGISLGQNFATPSNQLVSSGSPVAMQGVDGAFVGNYGTHTATNVHLAANVTFTPTGGSPSSIHTATVTLASFDNTNTATDSIWAMYMPAYNLTGITGNGLVKVKYTITSDSVDQFAADDTTSAVFYTTDSLYSKGRYDFTNNRPIANLYEAATITAGDVFYMWGNMYYINKSGTAADRVEWTMSSNTDTAGLISSLSSISAYVFRWVEGMNSQPVDSFIQNGELELVGLAVKDFTTLTAGDTSGGYFTAAVRDSNGVGAQPMLSANSWYYVAVELPGEASTVWFLGCDGNNNAYPRTYGRWQNNFVEYAAPVWPAGRYQGTDAQVNTFTTTVAPCPFGGSYNVDSVIFSQEKGLIPSVPLYVNNHPSVGIPSVKQVFATFDLYPNPANEFINVSLGLDNPAKVVTYTVLNSSARVVSKVTHNNVQTEKYTYSTVKLPAGNYFMVVTADGKEMFKKFTVLR